VPVIITINRLGPNLSQDVHGYSSGHVERRRVVHLAHFLITFHKFDYSDIIYTVNQKRATLFSTITLVILERY